MKKSSKKPILVATHPATKFLNYIFSGCIKPLCNNKEGLYEELHELHLKNREERGPLSYITGKEIKRFILEKNPKAFTEFPEQCEIMVDHFAAALNWKQFKQIYKFQPQLIDELWDIDFTDDKYEALSPDEIFYLPCYSFFVDLPMSFYNQDYVGFYAYFDNHQRFEDNASVMHILFISDIIIVDEPNYKGPTYECFKITLAYDFKTYRVKSRETGEEMIADIETKEILKALNPHVFKDLGEEKALEIIIKVNQIVNYLACSNADFTLVKKPTRKPDLKRTKITDLEHTEYRLGDTYAKLASGKSVNTRYLGDNPEAYTKSEVTEESDNHTDREYYTKRTGYHVRPHMRKAHWKYYWYGKKDGSEERIKRKRHVSAVYINNTGEEIEMPTREIVKLRF